MEELTGRTLGDFVVRHRVGEGGFGAVYRAEQVALGRDAVIKVLHPRLRNSKTLIQRFLREARLASKLDHPYAAHVYAFGVEPDGLMWIAMEYVKGQTLHEILRAHGPMPLETLVPLLDRICEVLEAAHELGIVHRDIKPPNVMVVQRSGRAFPKLLDFGVAKLTTDEILPTTPEPSPAARATPTPPRPIPLKTLVADEPVAPGDRTISFVGQPGGALGGVLAVASDPKAGLARTMEAPAESPVAYDPSLTEAGAAVGSPPYMAPEQWVDSTAVTARTDLYALGVMTYEALTGRRPFIGTSLLAFATAHATAAVPTLGENLPSALDDVMKKALAKEPAERYASALEFALAFRSAAGFGTQPLPTLDEDLRTSIEASFPQPIAEAVSAFHTSRNPHQGRDALKDIATIAIRYVAMIALASQAQVRLAEVGGSTQIAELLRTLRRRPLRDEEWLLLARELVAPFRSRAHTHPFPELVTLLLGDGDRDPFAAVAQPRTAQPDPFDAIRELLPDITRLLRALTCLADYPLVVVADGRAESWMGVRRPRRIAHGSRGRAIADGQPALLDAGGRPTIVLWPVVQTSSPMPGAPVELFLLDGGGRRGARMVAMPNPLERQDERVWEWIAETFASHDRDTPVSFDSTDARPYRGLSAFTSQDADAFVGREREVDAAVNWLTTRAFVAVVGPSGAGKSSVVHAGILPSLPKTWTSLSVRPGASPIATLEHRLRRAGFEVSDLAGALERDPNALGKIFDARDAPTVLVIDQFEELFTLGATNDERRLYVRALLAAAQAPEDNLRVILTLRDDFLGRATQIPELRDRLPTALFLLGTPAHADLVRILTEPLAKQGFDFEDPSLPKRMVDEVADTPGALALLSFTASKLWELRDRHFRQLTRSAYDALGGVAGALAQHAESTLGRLSSNEQRLARTALGHLVTAEGTRASLTRTAAAQLLRDPAASSVLEKLVDARLLVTTESEGGDDRVEIIHEALLVAWPRLAEWRREDLEGARLRDQVRAAARQWVERNRPRGLLWRDDALVELSVWRTRHPAPMTDAEEAFVGASLAEATRGRRLRRGVIGVVIGLMAIAVAVSLWARANVQATAEEDRQRVLRELVERGRQNVLAGNAADAREAFAEARGLGATDTTTLLFLEGVAALPIRGRTSTMRGHTARIVSVEFSPDGKRVLSASADGTARLWDAASASEASLLARCNGALAGASFDPTGRRIVVACDDGVVRLYANGQLEHELLLARRSSDQAHETFARFSSDGTRLVTSFGVLELWDVATGRRHWAATAKPQGLIAISPDNKLIASMSRNEPVATLWDATTGAPLHAIRLTDLNWEALRTFTSALEFDPTGKYLLTVANRTEVVQIWDVVTGNLAGQLEARAGQIRRLLVSADGRRVAIASLEHVIQIWSFETRTLQHAVSIGAKQAHELRFSPNDKLLGATMDDGSVAIWSVELGTQLAHLQGHDGAVSALGFDRATERVVTGGADMTAIVWTLRDLATTKVLAHDSPMMNMAVRGDRMLVATGDATVRNVRDGSVIARRRIGPNADARFVDDRAIGIVDQAGTLWLWDLERSIAHEIARHKRPGDWVVTDGQGSLASWAGPEIIVADVPRRGVRYRWLAPAEITAAVFVSGGNLAIADARGNVHVLGGSGQPVAAWRARGRVAELRALADGRLVGASRQVVQLWSATGQVVHEFAHPSGDVGTIMIDHAEARMATAGLDGTVRIWDLGTTLKVAELPSLADSLAFSDDDQLLAMFDHEGIASIWSIAANEPLYRSAALRHRGVVGLTKHTIVVISLTAIVVIPLL